MKKAKIMTSRFYILLFFVPVLLISCTPGNERIENGPLVIVEQGSFAAGGTLSPTPVLLILIIKRPQDKPFMVTMLMFSIRYLKMPESILW
jgi:hypothetical protein